VVKAVVAVMDESGSSVVVILVRHGSGLNQEDLGGRGINSSTLHPKPSKVGEAVPSQIFHVARRELKRK
jgi:hypothetical protein